MTKQKSIFGLILCGLIALCLMLGGTMFLTKTEKVYANGGTSSTVADILPNNFPGSDKSGWANENGSMAYAISDNLYFSDKSKTPVSIYISKNKTLIQSDDNYIATEDNVTYTFTMTSNVLTSITVSGATTDALNGTYTSSQTISTIDDVLKTVDGGFPKTEACGWGNSQSFRAYISNNIELRIGSLQTINIGNSVVFDDGNYKYSSSDISVVFVMNTGKLVKIVVSGSNSGNDGEYKVPDATMASILPDDFPIFNDSLPSNAWVNNKGIYMILSGDALLLITNDLQKPLLLASDIEVAVLTKVGNNYLGSSDGLTITFVMINNELTSIEIQGLIDDYVDFNGSYALPAPKIGDIFTYEGINYKVMSVDGTKTVAVGDNTSFTGTSLTIPETVTYFGDTFKVTGIANSAFNHVTTLTSVMLPINLSQIDGYAFFGCLNLKMVICNAITTPILGGEAFKECDALTTIYVPASAVGTYKTATDWSAYADKIEAIVELPVGATWLVNEGENHVWYKLNKVVPATEPVTYNLTIGGAGAMPDFKKDDQPWYDVKENITEIVVNEGITKISDNAFRGCSKITSFVVPNSVAMIGLHAFNSCSKLQNLTISGSVTEIGDFAFEHCGSLVNIVIPEGVKEIRGGAFAFCDNLLTVTLPISVTSIGMNVFKQCINLNTVMCYATTPPSLGINAFVNHSDNLKIYVALGSVDTYKSADVWNGYAENIEPYYTIADVLPEDFPRYTDAFPANAWKNDQGSVVYLNAEGTQIVTNDGNIDVTIILDFDGSKYTFKSFMLNWQFVLDNNAKLVKLVASGGQGLYQSCNGEYLSPKTIENILPIDFPKWKDYGWINENDSKLFVYNGYLYVNDTPLLAINTYLNPAGDNFYYSDTVNHINYDFDIKNGALEKIHITYTQSDASEEGDYIDPNAITIASILPDNFPQTKDTGWENANGAVTYISNSNIYFNLSGEKIDYFPVREILTKVEDGKYCYVRSGDNVYFYTENDKVFKIEYPMCTYSEISGTYKQKTVAEIKPEYFFNGESSAWKNKDGIKIYLNGDNNALCFGSLNSGVSHFTNKKVTKNGKNYEYTFTYNEENIKIEFIMNEGVFNTLIVSGFTGNNATKNGTYYPAYVDEIFNVAGINYVVTEVGETNTVKVGDNSSFEGTSVTIPATVKYNGITFDVTEIDAGSFLGCPLTGIEIPASVKTIDYYAFTSCSNLTTVTFAENSQLETIGASAFEESGLLEIALPASTKSIGLQAFWGCTDLTTVKILATEAPTLGTCVFENCNKLEKIYVPKESVDTYKTATNWSAYADKIEAYYTIAEILPSDFPTTEANGWENENGVHLALKGNALVCEKDDQEYRLVEDITTAVLSYNKGRYSYTNGDNIKTDFYLLLSDKTDKINVSSSQYDGAYFPKLIPFEEDIDLTTLNLSGGWAGKTVSEVKASFGSKVDGLTINDVICSDCAKETAMDEDDVFVLDKTYELLFVLKAPDGCYFSNELGEVKFYFAPYPIPRCVVYAGTITSNATFSYAIVGGYTLEGDGSVVVYNGSRPYNALQIGFLIEATKPIYTVTFNSDDQSKGTIDIEEMAGIVEDSTYSVNGNKLTVGGTEITATPNKGYEFDCWKIGETVVTGSGTITADTTFTAVFKEKQLAVLDVLATVDGGFPTTEATAWVNLAKSSKIFINEGQLCVTKGDGLLQQSDNVCSISDIVEKDTDNNYIINGTLKIKFVMDNTNKLSGIEISCDSIYSNSFVLGTFIAPITIAKPSANTTNFVYDGTEKTYTLTTNDAYTISDNTTQTEVGTYTITVSLKNAQYKWVDGTTEDLTYKFVINQKLETVEIKQDGEVITDKSQAKVSIIEANDGIAPEAVFVVKTIENTDKTALDNTKEVLKGNDLLKNQRVAAVYDAKLLIGTQEVQPNGTITIKMLVPTDLQGKNFVLFHIHNSNDVETITEYTDLGDGYISFEITKLSEFAFTVDNPSLSTGAIVGIVIGGIVVLALIAYILGYFILYRTNKLENTAFEKAYQFLPKKK